MRPVPDLKWQKVPCPYVGEVCESHQLNTFKLSYFTNSPICGPITLQANVSQCAAALASISPSSLVHRSRRRIILERRKTVELDRRRQQHVDDDETRSEQKKTKYARRRRTTQDTSCRRSANVTIHHALRLMYRTPQPPVIRACTAAAVRRIFGELATTTCTRLRHARTFLRRKNCLIIVAGEPATFYLVQFLRRFSVALDALWRGKLEIAIQQICPSLTFVYVTR